MPQIKQNQTSTAFFGGYADMNWVKEKSAEAFELAKGALLNGYNFLKDVISGKIDLKQKIKEGWGWLKNWFKKDPVKAGLVVAGGVVIVAGVSVIVGGATLGILGAGIGAIAKVGALVGAGAAINAGLGNPIQAGIRLLVRATQTVYNFNFNISDKEIRAKQEALMNSIIINAGGALGRALGGLICGASAGLATVQIDTKLMANIFSIIDDDTKEEILDSFTELIYYTRVAAAEMAFLQMYKNARDWIKSNIKTGITKIDDAIKAWGEEGSKPWVLAEKVEEVLETIPNETVRATAENFLEEFADMCVEALYQVA